MDVFHPAYLKSLSKGQLKTITGQLHSILKSCRLCPRKCGVNRIQGELGFCKGGMDLKIASYNPHFGEESPLVGQKGSGTIFLSECHLLCVFCQNYEISHLGDGDICSPEEASKIMLHLQDQGCHNINLVSPSHYAPQLIQALYLAAKNGLHIPLVWNCSGYENIEIIKLLEGIVDIYMPDFKFSNNKNGEKYCGIPDYFERTKETVTEMFRQVGDLKTDERGIASGGLLVRHLMMPGDTAGSPKILEFLAELSKDTYINLMNQYRPMGEGEKFPAINRFPSPFDFLRVEQTAISLGLHRGF